MMKMQKQLSNLKKVWAGKRLPLLAIIASGALAVLSFGTNDTAYGTAVMPVKDMQKMTYEVYAGGINAVKASLDVAYDSPEDYRLELIAETQGFLGKLVPWSGKFETEGWRLNDGGEFPRMHKSTAIWRGENDIKEYVYNKDGTFESYRVIEAGEDKTPKNLDPELVEGTTDALTATLDVMKKIATEGKCEGRSEVFDGKRRFELVFNHEADEVLEATRYNIYEGPSVRCSVEVVPVAGKWHSKPRGWMSIQEQGRERGALPTVWLAKIDDEGPAIPVKVRIKTEYGTLFSHLVQYQNEQGVALKLDD